MSRFTIFTALLITWFCIWPETTLGRQIGQKTPGSTERQKNHGLSNQSPRKDSQESAAAPGDNQDVFSLTPGLDEAKIREGWLSLFDGISLYGWRAESEVNWTVRDGEIQADQGTVGLLRTTTQFGDYELKLEFRADASTNSGIFLRTSPQPKDPTIDCYELNIAAPDNPFPTGSLVGRSKSNAVLALGDRETWHQLHVRNQSGDFEITIDGNLALKFNDPKPLGRGFVGLQYNQGFIAFRNISLRPLGLVPIFNGKNLDGWNVENKLESQFHLSDQEELRIIGGRGQIETEGTFGDFGLAMDCKTGAVGLNSGVFFRCIPGQIMNGYESQIHHGIKNNDPTQPADFGTGGIFRREPARRVVSRDLEWFHKTLFATGPHVAVWINGYQVCDWTDTREPHENPRNGKRLEAGTIILQGHDPTTDILFRNIQAAELPPRRRLTKTSEADETSRH